MNYTSRILQFIPKGLMKELYSIAMDVLIPDNNTKVNKMVAALESYNVPFEEIGPGTNRFAILIDGYIFKIGMDKAGIRDNWAELSLTQELQPFVTKVYECNGLINVAEYVTVISKEEFQESKEEVRQILSHLAQGYLLGDVGSINKNFMNWGYRADGQLVILDFAYIYRVVGDEMMCGGLNNDDSYCQEFLEYDENFNNLICPKCHKKYTFHDIRRRIDREFEQKELDMIKQVAVKVTKANTDVNTKDPETKINESINNNEGESIMGKHKNIVSVELDPEELYAQAMEFAANMYSGNVMNVDEDIEDSYAADTTGYVTYLGFEDTAVDTSCEVDDAVAEATYPDDEYAENDVYPDDAWSYNDRMVEIDNPESEEECETEEEPSVEFNEINKDDVTVGDVIDNYYEEYQESSDEEYEDTETEVEVDDSCDVPSYDYEKILLSDDVEVSDELDTDPIHIDEDVEGVDEEVDDSDLINTAALLDIDEDEDENPYGPNGENYTTMDCGVTIVGVGQEFNVNEANEYNQQSPGEGKVLILSDDDNVEDMRNELMAGLSDDEDITDEYDDLYDDCYNDNQRLKNIKRNKNNR